MVYISYVLIHSGEGVGVQTSPYQPLGENELKHVSLFLLCVIFQILQGASQKEGCWGEVPVLNFCFCAGDTDQMVIYPCVLYLIPVSKLCCPKDPLLQTSYVAVCWSLLAVLPAMLHVYWFALY